MTDLIGRLIENRYRVESFLGKGGMAEVYRVRDEARSVPLAMKVLYADMAEDKVFLRRFKREAQTLEKMQHPNIVRFYGMEKSDGLVFLLMDYVEGTTLRKEIFETDTPFSMERVLDVMQPVTAALHYAHQSGFVHCDVKPANIMLHKNGNILVADFGISRMSESATVTMAGAGTPAYMSPEQITGDMPTPQMDIYALGIILFELLTGGERPFTGEHAGFTATTAEKVRWEQRNLEPPSPCKYNPSISPALEKVVLTCLQKDPSTRYKTALDVYTILKKISDVASSPPQERAGKIHIGGDVSSGVVVAGNGNIINVNDNPIISDETNKQLQELESRALRFELEGRFWDALRLQYEIKLIDPLFPRVDVKIKQLENEVQLKPMPSPAISYSKETTKTHSSSIANYLSVAFQFLKSLPRIAWAVLGALFSILLLTILLARQPAAKVEGNNGFYISSNRTGEMQIYHLDNNGKIYRSQMHQPTRKQ